MKFNFHDARNDDNVPQYVNDLMELVETLSVTNIPKDGAATVTMTNEQWFYLLDCMILSRQVLEGMVPERLDPDMPDELMQMAAEIMTKRNQVREFHPKVFGSISDILRQQVADALVKDIKL
jgi:hypothetical protein